MAEYPLILAIETATGCGSVSLTRGGVTDGMVLGEITAQPKTTHSRRLLGSVATLLETAGIGWDDLDGVAVSLGPGSFTGLRIGMAAAKGIAMATGLPMLGVASLDGLALGCPHAALPLCCVLDARKKQVYAAMYSYDRHGVPVRQGKIRAVEPAALAASITTPTLLFGPAVSVYGKELAATDLIRPLPRSLAVMRAAPVGLLAADRLRRGEVLDAATVAPLYIRASEAELNRERQQSRKGSAGREGEDNRCSGKRPGKSG